MTRYHVSEDGLPRECGAKAGGCPFAEDAHGDFETPQNARSFAEAYLAEKHPETGPLRKSIDSFAEAYAEWKQIHDSLEEVRVKLFGGERPSSEEVSRLGRMQSEHFSRLTELERKHPRLLRPMQ